MASVLFTISSSVINVLSFSGTAFLFCKLLDHGEKEYKRQDLALQKLRRLRDKWNKDGAKCLSFIYKKLRENN